MSDDGLAVTGGEGGIEVAVDDLRRAAGRLRRSADAVSRVTPREVGVVLQAPMVPLVGLDWGLGQRVLGAPIDLEPLVGRCRRDLADLVADVAGAVERLRELGVTTDQAAAGYAAAEARARGLVAGLHDQAMGLAWLVSETTGRAFGLLDEGDGWDVAVAPVDAQDCVPVPTSTDSLLAGIQSLGGEGTEGRVRVIEVLAMDGTTTWVVQIPGTHGGWFEGGEVPMDWPANVSLMLGATSASKVAVARALEQAQAGRAGPRDRVVLAGHSQGGIVAAALASDPSFTRAHRVTHVVTAGSPIDDFPIPDSTEVLSLQHHTDPVHALDVSPPRDGRSWTTVEAAAPITVGGHLSLGAHALTAYRSTASRVDRSSDVSLQHWRSGLAPVLGVAPGAKPVVHEFRSERRWQNRDS
ncbi:alpha/beta hydrolase [Knoellia sp. CPCC 206453]|uniref:PGAP1-like alpha/beta domain-containing protein n=1 Tax=Knoellia pratensis TaxID=3404796 RepID=UPI00361BB901